jgi:phospholipid/cholesterol/gamma-HCH transport system substrate-binding protein
MSRRSTVRSDFSRWYGPLGLLAILLVALVGWIAYRANSGLPGQSRYEVNVLIPDADRLIDAADVRIGGVLVGEVLNVTAEPSRGGAPYARVKLALSPSVGELPTDSTVQVRPASVLGLTYVDITLGHSRQLIGPGGTLPLARARPSSDLTDLFQIFNHSAASGFQRSISGLAYGLAGRGQALNSTLGSLASLMPALTGAMRTFAAPATQLARFLSGYESTADALAPVSNAFAELISNGAMTFAALDSVRGPLAAAIDAAPGAESATTAAFTDARPALNGLARLAVDLRPAAQILPQSLLQANLALSAGVRPLREFPGFSRPLRTALGALEGLARDPVTVDALRKLRDLVNPTNGVLSVVTPAQVYCNVLGLYGSFGSLFGQLGDGNGPAIPLLTLTGAGAIGEQLQNPRPSVNLNLNPLPVENASACQSGNERWTGAQHLNNPGPTGNTTRNTVPPPGVVNDARAAGLLDPIPGASK